MQLFLRQIPSFRIDLSLLKWVLDIISHQLYINVKEAADETMTKEKHKFQKVN